MKPERQRVLTMFSVIGAGSVLILFDAPLVLLICGTLATGLLVMMLTGSIHISRKRSAAPEKETTVITKKIPSEERNKAIVPKAGKSPETVKRRSFREMLSPLLQLWKKEKNPPHPAEKVKKIDQMLDTLIAASPVSTPAPSMEGRSSSSSGGGPSLGLAPLKELTNAQLEDDLLIPDPEKDEEIQGVDSPIATLDLAPPVPIALDADTGTDEVEDILKAHEGEMGSLDNLGEMEFSMDSLESIDLESVDLGADTPTIVTGPAPTPVVPSPSPVASAPPVVSPPIRRDSDKVDEMVAFSKGGTGGDDFMAALKSDVGQVRKSRDLSLLRDMKDENPMAHDLEDELQMIASHLKAKISTDKKGQAG